MTKKQNRGFTLIELLIVVLIIGILAAVAVPQYRVAVAKSKFTTLKTTVDTLVKAEEIYYLANGQYTDDIEKLDISMPDIQSYINPTITYPWGTCTLNTPLALQCELNTPKLSYVYYLAHGTYPGHRICQIPDTTNAMDWRNNVCRAETGQQNSTTSSVGTPHLNYWYP